MIKILFLCHGNICRSPMAEFIMKDLVKKVGLEQKIIQAVKKACHCEETQRVDVAIRSQNP